MGKMDAARTAVEELLVLAADFQRLSAWLTHCLIDSINSGLSILSSKTIVLLTAVVIPANEAVPKLFPDQYGRYNNHLKMLAGSVFNPVFNAGNKEIKT